MINNTFMTTYCNLYMWGCTEAMPLTTHPRCCHSIRHALSCSRDMRRPDSEQCPLTCCPVIPIQHCWAQESATPAESARCSRPFILPSCPFHFPCCRLPFACFLTRFQIRTRVTLVALVEWRARGPAVKSQGDRREGAEAMAWRS